MPGDGVNFIAAHDGFSLADLVAFEAKHNEANGEGNRDGHGENHSWNNGTEGPTRDPAIAEARRRDVRALLATLFVARGTPMIVAGDEMGRTQGGNNNGYAQDNETLWLDWPSADMDLAAFTARLAALRREEPALHADRFLTGAEWHGRPDVTWLGDDGAAMTPEAWNAPEGRFLGLRTSGGTQGADVLVYLNAAGEARDLSLPEPRPGHAWSLALQSDRPDLGERPLGPGLGLSVGARSVFILVERLAA
jgi:glycogen operon protein